MRWLSQVFMLAIVTCCSSCGVLYYGQESAAHKKMRLLGYEQCHIESCGPDALADAFKDLDIKKNYIQIAKEIQDADRIHYRTLLSVASHEFTRITCPPELLRYCRSQGLKVTKIEYNHLRNGDVAIVLLRGRNDIRDWHWIAWPNNSKETIKNYFGEDTKILSVYLLRK